MGTVKQKFKKDIQSLDTIFNYLDDFVEACDIDSSVAYELNLIVEELFTNMVKYGSVNSQEVEISLERKGNSLFLVFTDFDVDSFDITELSDVNTCASIDERKVGGLGIHLVKTIADTVEYEYCNRQSIITVIKEMDK